MYRKAIFELERWKNSSSHKPLIVKGARQVGKTWLVKFFGEEYFDNLVYINFDKDETAKNIFNLDYNIERIISRLAAHTHQDISPEKSLIFLDEVQECPKALESLKYFAEDHPEYFVVAAGSLLGVYMNVDGAFPVGKVDFVNIYPLDFCEFLYALGEKEIAKAISNKDFEFTLPFHDKLIDLYKTYLVTGGMPAVVNKYIETKSFNEVRKEQEYLVEAYNRDFGKHAPTNEIPRIIEIFNIVPNILAKENKKFMFGAIREGARAREYEAALLWLVNAGIVTKVTCANKIALPISAYSNHDIFKLFYLDVGLLGYMARLRPETIFADEPFLKEFKGAMAEQFVFQELISHEITPFYYSKDNSRVELDFLVDTSDGPTPIEVKSGVALASKSFAGVMRENGELKLGYKISLLPYKVNDRIVNLPIYLTGEI
ncbi:ATP-binding protein [Candidatus Saccharibacteria bacterium]|nr:ATP-binding protein [Candidatus Saccharibacteria bacterium]